MHNDQHHRLETGREVPRRARRYAFHHHSLDAYHVALEALVQGTGIAGELPRGYGKLKDQLERALQGAFLQTSEAAARIGTDRKARFRAARGEACEAAAALEALDALGVVDAGRTDPVLSLLWRLCGMLTRLGGLGRR